MEKKRVERKNWTKVFEDRAWEKRDEVEKYHEKKRKEEDEFHQQNVGRAIETKRAVLPLPRHSQWETHWGSSSLCSLCNTPAINQTTVCKQCNCIAHNICISNDYDERSYSSQTIGNSEGYYVCQVCEENIAADIADVETMRTTVRYQELVELCKTIIGRKARSWLTRRCNFTF